VIINLSYFQSGAVAPRIPFFMKEGGGTNGVGGVIVKIKSKNESVLGRGIPANSAFYKKLDNRIFSSIIKIPLLDV